MKQIISKLFSRVAAVAAVALLTAATAWADSVTWSGTTALPGSFTSIGSSPIQIKTSSTNSYTDPIRVYANTTITIQATDGYVINSVTYEAYSTGNYVTYAKDATVTPDVTPTVSGKNVTWTLSDAIEFTFTPSSQTRCNGITVVYSAEGSASAVQTTTTISSSGITNTDVYLSTNAGTLSATVKDNQNNAISGATVSWSGNNDEVATINASSGAVTLVAPGTVTFTASYAGVANQYQPSTATYTMTVTSSAPYVQPTEFVINLNDNLFGTNYGGSASGITDSNPLTGTKDNVTVTYAGGGNHYVNNSQIRLYPSNKLTFEAPSGYDIKSIVFTPDGTWTATISADKEEYNSSTKTWTGSASAVIFSGSGSGRCDMSKVTITIGKAAPSIVANNVDIAYDATSGSIAFSIQNEPTPAGTLTASTESDWLTVGSAVGSSVSFTCTANNTAAERTANVTLSYSYGDNESVTKEVTVTQARNPNVVPTISQVRAQGTGSVDTKGVVTTIAIGTSNKTAYIQDASAAIVVYGNFTASVGDEIRVSGTLSTFNGLLEITNPTVTVLSQNNTVTPTVMTIAEINSSSNQGWYVKIEDATVTAINDQNTTISQGENSIVVRGISEDIEYGINDIITLEGNIGCYNTVQISNPTNVTKQEVTTPSITVTPATVSVPAALSDPNEELGGTLDLTYANLTISSMNDFAVQFYDADGAEIQASEVSWVYALVAEQDPSVGEGYVVSYGLEENEGAARTAYFKVFAIGDDDYVYSNLVTVTQAAPVIDYATLPFSWTSNYGTAPQGITNNGVSTGGSGSSAYLKFDSQGDNIVLKINECPGTLSFTVKGNPSEGTTIDGTFKVQISVDGVTYYDLETYNNLSNTNHEESFSAIPGNVRFIKWVYTNKVSGNVALSNITLAEQQPAAAPETYELTLAAGDGGCWGTFYNGAAGYVLPEGAQAFTMNADKQLYRLGDDNDDNSRGKYIPANTAVVIISDVSEITLTKGESAEPVSVNGGENILLGDDFPVAKTDNQYVLGKKNNVIGFFKFTGTSIPANKAYYVVSE